MKWSPVIEFHIPRTFRELSRIEHLELYLMQMAPSLRLLAEEARVRLVSHPGMPTGRHIQCVRVDILSPDV